LHLWTSSGTLAVVSTPASHVTIRPAYADDQLSLLRLAALDSAPKVPPAPLLVAEVDGVLRAALSVARGSAIADPFFPTVQLLELLRGYAAASDRQHSLGRRRFPFGRARAQFA
jgi:hypothetical protein